MILLYLAVFSNLFSGCILAIYAFWRTMCLASQTLCRRMSVRECLKKGALFIGVLAVWMLSVVYEVAGGRAANPYLRAKLWTRIKETVPVCDSEDNFPYAYAMGGRIISALSNHGMIDRLEVIHMEPTEGFYAEFGIE